MSKVKVGEDVVQREPGGTTEQPHDPTLPDPEMDELDLNSTIDSTIERLENRAERLERLIENIEKL